MKKFYQKKELDRKSYYDLHKICVDEKLIEGFATNINRVEMINLILKYRGKKKLYTINEANDSGLFYLQEFFDKKLGFMLNHNGEIKVPHKITMYKGMDITNEDNYIIKIPEGISGNNVYLINGDSYLCGIFQLEAVPSQRNTYFLIGSNNFFRLEGLYNQNYSLLLFNSVDDKFVSETYYKGRYNGFLPSLLSYYKVPLDGFNYEPLEVTSNIFCMDFGSANTTAGIYLDRNYVSNLPQNKILSGQIKLNQINYVNFLKGEKYSKVFPTTVYVKNCFDRNNIQYLFGYEVDKELKENNYNLRGSLFYGIKNWVKTINSDERIVDENGDVKIVKRKEIIKAYIDFILKRGRSLFKCQFNKIHITTPVKLKYEFLSMFKEILPDYRIVDKGALDEGVAVLYNTLESIIYKEKFEDNREYKGLIIDCGGGTTDLASCVFKVDSRDINYNLDIRTTFENSEDSFGGNNITYRIFQYLKIIFSHYYTKKNIDINMIIPFETELIYNEIDELGRDAIYKDLEEIYRGCEKVIPTKYVNFENKASEDYKKVKNNFFFLWEIADELKKTLFKESTIIRTRFDNIHFTNGGLTNTYVENWKLFTNRNGILDEQSIHPDIIITKVEILKVIKGDIYEVFRRFLTEYYESEKLQEYSLIKLSGQSCKVNLFNEILKEFVPGKMIDFKRNVTEAEEQLKISCLDGALKYLNSKKIGNIKSFIKNDIPIVPYTLIGTTYNNEEEKLISIGEQSGRNHGWIKKISSTEILSLALKNKEGELKKEYTFINRLDDYREVDESGVITLLEDNFVQEELDDIYNEETKFFIYTDKNYWGFFVCGVRRDEDQLFIGNKEYFSFEEDGTSISFFDGKH